MVLLAFVIYPNFVRARTNGNRPAHICISNRKQMQSAIEQWAREKRRDGQAVPTSTEIFGTTNYIKHPIRCPDMGTYWWGGTNDPVVCSIHGAQESNLLGELRPVD